MHKSRILTGVAAAALIVAAPAALTSNGAGVSPVPAAQAQQVQVSFDLFYDRLDDHGRWVRHDPYGYVWVPTVVGADWAPYTHGRWVYTDRYGWYFTSDEPFAWAAYHYGRWGYEPDVGWFWVPGRTWAPAWVAWRTGPDYVGWAPLPPRRDGASISVSIDIGQRDLPRPYWHFVPVRQFVSPRLETVIVRGHREPDIFQRTEFLGPVHVEGDMVVNNVVEVNYIEQNIDQEIVTYNIETIEDPDQSVTAELEGETIRAFQAEVAEAPQAEPPQVAEMAEVSEEAPTAQQVDEAELQAFEAEDGEDVEADVTADEAAPADEQEADVTEETAPADEQEAEVTTQEAAPVDEDAEVTTQEAAPVDEQDAEVTTQEAAPVDEDAEVTTQEAAPADEQDAEVTTQDTAPAEETITQDPEGTGGEAGGTQALEAPQDSETQSEPEATEPAPQPDAEAAPEPEQEELLQQQ